jgi:hypothetical protein
VSTRWILCRQILLAGTHLLDVTRFVLRSGPRCVDQKKKRKHIDYCHEAGRRDVLSSKFNQTGWRTPGGLIIAKIYFTTDQWEELTPDAARCLDDLAKHYGPMLKRGHKIKLTFVGRADTRASAEYNWSLAMGRAIVARGYVDQRLIAKGGYTADSFSTGELHSGDTMAEDRRVDVYLGLKKPPPPRPPSRLDLERAKVLLRKRREIEKKITRIRKAIKNLRSWLEPAQVNKTLWILQLFAKVVAGGRGDLYAPPGLAEELERESDERMKEAIPGKVKDRLLRIRKHMREIKRIDLEVRRLTQAR